MSRLIVLTVAYNAGKTLRRAIDSVVNQTYQDWIYYVIDNGSVDGTREIITEYAQYDKRILQRNYDENYPYRIFDFIQEITQAGEGDFFISLDSDDAYKQDFFSDMLHFVWQHDLEFAATGNEFISAKDGRLLGNRAFSNNALLCTGEDFVHLEDYYGLIRPVWAKFFSINLLRKIKFDYVYDIIYGSDTAFCLEALKNCQRFGILAGVYYKYYVNPASDSYRYYPQRVQDDQLLFDLASQFLVTKCGYVSSRNSDFLLAVYMNALKDTLQILLNAQISVLEKLSNLISIFSDAHTKRLLSSKDFGVELGQALEMQRQRKELFASVANWLLTLKEVPDEQAEDYCNIGEIACAVAEDPAAWVSFNKLKVRLYIDQGQIKKASIKLDELKELLPDDEDVRNLSNLLLRTGENKEEGMDYFSSKKSRKPPIKPQNGCDISFYKLMNCIKDNSLEKLLTDAANSAVRILDEDHEYFGLLLKWYKSWYGVGALHPGDQGFVNYFGSMYNYLRQQSEALESLYESLGDYRSKQTLKTILQHWLTFTPDIRKSGIESTFKHYFDLDIMRCTEDEVFVDCGAYNGDTVLDFIEQYGGRYKSIYSYELTPSMFKQAQEKLNEHKNIFLRNKGVSDRNGKMSFDDTVDAGNRLVSNGGTAIAEVVKIDDDIKEDISFLKMDIEGAEISALTGAQNHIRRSRPKLAISLYHKLSDLIEIPALCKRLVPEYHLYLRHHPADFPFPTEYVLYAVVD